jgi:PAS domain S-box-containing protein
MSTAITDIERIKRLSHITIQNAVVGILWFNPDGRIHHVNETICRMLGYSREELLGLSLGDLDPTYKTELFWFHLEKARGGTDCFESRIYSKDQCSFPVEITVTFTEFEDTTYGCCFMRNISERLRRDDELRNALSELEEIKQRLEEENVYLKEEIKLDHNFSELIGQSKNFKTVLRQIEQVSATDTTVLILGETGTGKELLARAVHNLSLRKERPLVKVNCASLPANLIESELFGHEKGAFTGAIARKAGRFELANGGTIFLDEVGDLPLELQPSLLRVLQEGEFECVGGTSTLNVDVRVIAATNRNLESLLEEGRFREDLYYRLNVVPIESVPLRERKEDIPALVGHFVDKYSPKIGKKIESIPTRVMALLKNYQWPGNVRELENIIERSMILSPGTELIIEDYFGKESPSPGEDELTVLREVERNHICKTLEKTNWRVSGEKGAAKILGLNSKTVESRMKKLGISRP